MPPFSTIRKQFQTLESIPQYFRAIAKEWMNILFGESLVGVVFLIWWALGSPPLVIIFLLAVLVAGYYAWRATFLHSVPKIGIKRFVVTQTPTSNAGIFYAYVHIIPECLTEAPVYECQGRLLRVLRKSRTKVEWEPTQIDEPLELVWSIYDDTVPRTLQPGIDTRLNLCFINNMDGNIYPAVQRLPLRCSKVFNKTDSFRFDIRLTARDCPATNASVILKAGASWHSPVVELFPSES